MPNNRVWIPFLIACYCVGSSWSNTLELRPSSAMKASKLVCNICEELKKETNVEAKDSLNEQLEKDRKDIRLALMDIEKNLNETNEKVWWLQKNDIFQLQNETEEIRESVLKASLGVKEIEAKTNAIRTKLELYEAEKETNKAKAVQQWGMLLLTRQRIYNIEKVFLDAVILAEDLATVAHMDRLRMFANAVAKKLKEVMDYYVENAPTVQNIHSSLHEIAVKKVELQTKNIGPKKNRCAFLFFFCD